MHPVIFFLQLLTLMAIISQLNLPFYRCTNERLVKCSTLDITKNYSDCINVHRTALFDVELVIDTSGVTTIKYLYTLEIEYYF